LENTEKEGGYSKRRKDRESTGDYGERDAFRKKKKTPKKQRKTAKKQVETVEAASTKKCSSPYSS